MKITKKRICFILIGCLGCLILCIFTAKAIWDHYAFSGYDAKIPANVTLLESKKHAGYIREKFTYQSLPGEIVPVLAVIPDERDKPCPAVIFLYGIGMKMKFADKVAEVFAKERFALFVPEHFNRGERRQRGKSNHLKDLFRLRHRAVLTVQESRRLVDVIEKRPDIDPERIYMWGASFGAITGCVAMSQETRFKAGVFTLSGGNFRKILTDTPLMNELRPWQRFLSKTVAAPLAAWFFRPVEPTLYVHKIAPRPLLFQNAQQDDIMPRSSVEAIYNKAGQPKKIVWYDCVHNRIDKDPQIILNIISDGLGWLKEQEGK